MPTALEHLSLDGVRQFARAYHHVVLSLNAALLGLVILPMRVDLRSNLQRDILERLTASFGLAQVAKGVRNDTAVSEAFGSNQPVRRYRGKTRAGRGFRPGGGRCDRPLLVPGDRNAAGARPRGLRPAASGAGGGLSPSNRSRDERAETR